jgi:uncharacterized cupin superfamily protein
MPVDVPPVSVRYRCRTHLIEQRTGCGTTGLSKSADNARIASAGAENGPLEPVGEARLEGGVPRSRGWFVVSVRDGQWKTGELGSYCSFQGAGEARFPELGVNLRLVRPGVPMSRYHQEENEEAFLVLRGECLLIVEGEERPLRQWDFFFSPPWTKHVIVGAGTEPALVFAVGRPTGGAINYPADEVARRSGAASQEDTSDPARAYSGIARATPGPVPRDLPLD